jgi:hypothetical protein
MPVRLIMPPFPGVGGGFDGSPVIAAALRSERTPPPPRLTYAVTFAGLIKD